MYLMSLTELSRTPFSLVDEINQVSLPSHGVVQYLTKPS